PRPARPGDRTEGLKGPAQPSGVLEPGERALLRLGASFTNQFALATVSPPIGTFTSGTPRGFGSGLLDLIGTASAGPAARVPLTFGKRGNAGAGADQDRRDRAIVAAAARFIDEARTGRPSAGGPRSRGSWMRRSWGGSGSCTSTSSIAWGVLQRRTRWSRTS